MKCRLLQLILLISCLDLTFGFLSFNSASMWVPLMLYVFVSLSSTTNMVYFRCKADCASDECCLYAQEPGDKPADMRCVPYSQVVSITNKLQCIFLCQLYNLNMQLVSKWENFRNRSLEPQGAHLQRLDPKHNIHDRCAIFTFLPLPIRFHMHDCNNNYMKQNTPSEHNDLKLMYEAFSSTITASFSTFEDHGLYGLYALLVWFTWSSIFSYQCFHAACVQLLSFLLGLSL